MNQKLWEVIKQISERKEFGEFELAMAGKALDHNTLAALKEHYQNGKDTKSPQWV